MKTFSLTTLLVLSAFILQSQSVLRYNFNNTLNESGVTGPVLSILGNQGTFLLDTLNEISGKTKTVYRFEKNSGFQFDNAAAGNFLGETYTIELYFVFDNLASWKRVVDWKNRKTDKGAYVFNGQLNFYNFIYSGQAPVVAEEYTYYVITRDGATGKLLIYTDADVQISFTDALGDGVIDADHVLNFFHDDLQVPNEASSGAVALLNLYNYVLDSTTIKTNWDNLNSQVFGVSDHRKSNAAIKVLPNPADDQTVVNLSNLRNDGIVKLALLDLTGSAIFTARIEPGDKYLFPMPLNTVPSGFYFIRAESKTKISTHKLLIQH